jgi:D-alanyl-lipoteichoic acid acyltransferase DltB (MBOAT superfamily)
MFTVTVLCDVVTRTIGAPWLWLQQVTTAFFAWGAFIGMAAATRRNDHFYLTEITKRMTGAPRTVIEVVNRIIVLIVAVLLVWCGTQNALLDLGARKQYRLASRAHCDNARQGKTVIFGDILTQVVDRDCAVRVKRSGDGRKNSIQLHSRIPPVR